MTDQEKEKLRGAAKSIMRFSRNSLVINLRFMDTAISRLNWAELPDEALLLPGMEQCVLSTDGESIFYSPLLFCLLYKAEKNLCPRAYLHLVMHCVFRHFMVSPTVDRDLWDLACNMAVEGVINSLDVPSVDWSGAKAQQSELEKIGRQVSLLTAEKIYRYLRTSGISEDEIRRLSRIFRLDSHAVWYLPPKQQQMLKNSGAGQPSPSGGEDSPPQQDSPRQQGSPESETSPEGGESGNGRQDADGPQDPGKPQDGDTSSQDSDSLFPRAGGIPSRERLEQDWRDVASRLQTDLETFSKQKVDTAGSLMQNLREVNREKYDYTAFLKKFAVMGEAMKINDDEFDYIFYTYGMKLFPEKRLPLIEPLEYKEVKRIKEFVIAIDTSGSVAGDEVQTFLQKTYNILKNTESFFSRIDLHIIQCDAEIQEDVKITNQEEFDRYLAHMTIKGLGGTDFQPVFDHVDALIRNREFTNLKGLIYFTDGYGTFPEKMPAYKTAFVFVQDGYDIPEVPVWAVKLVLQKEELSGG